MINNDKLINASKLSKEINEITDFYNLIKKGLLTSSETKHKGDNCFSEISLSAYIYTGSDNPEYHQRIQSNKIIKLLVEPMKETLEKLMKEKEEEYNLLFR